MTSTCLPWLRHSFAVRSYAWKWSERTRVVVGWSPLHFYTIHDFGGRAHLVCRLSDCHIRSICFSIVSLRSFITSTRLESIRSITRFAPRMVNIASRKIRMMLSVTEESIVCIKHEINDLISCINIEAVAEPIHCHIRRAHSIKHEILQFSQAVSHQFVCCHADMMA